MVQKWHHSNRMECNCEGGCLKGPKCSKYSPLFHYTFFSKKKMNTEVICQQHKKLGMNFDTNKRHESQGSVFTLDANWPRRLARMERKRKSQQNFLFLISLICTLGK